MRHSVISQPKKRLKAGNPGEGMRGSESLPSFLAFHPPISTSSTDVGIVYHRNATSSCRTVWQTSKGCIHRMTAYLSQVELTRQEDKNSIFHVSLAWESWSAPEPIRKYLCNYMQWLYEDLHGMTLLEHWHGLSMHFCGFHSAELVALRIDSSDDTRSFLIKLAEAEGLEAAVEAGKLDTESRL